MNQNRTLAEIRLELKKCLEDYESQGTRLTRKAIREYVFKSHASSKNLTQGEKCKLVVDLVGMFL